MFKWIGDDGKTYRRLEIDGILRSIIIGETKTFGSIVKHVVGGDNSGFIESAKDKYTASDLGVKEYNIRSFRPRPTSWVTPNDYQ